MKEWMGSNNRGLAILRVSSQRQRDNISHEAQEREIRDYCARNGIAVETIFRIIESAKDSDNRKQYGAAIKTALTQGIRHVLFYMYDREARNLTDNEKNEKLVRNNQIAIHYVRDNKILHCGSPDSEFFIRDVQAAANKQYSRSLGVKVVDAMRQKAESGWYPGHKPPLGYVHQRMRDQSGRELKAGTTIVPDPDERKVAQVRREFELRAQGLSFRAIRDQIVREGHVPHERAAKYQHAIIEYRIKSVFYQGRFVWDGIEYEGKHELIIPREVLAQVARAEGGRKHLRVAHDGHGVFGGSWLRCADCGCSIVYERKQKWNRAGELRRTYHFYRCSNGRREHATLAGLHVSEEWLWEQFDQAVGRLTLPEAFAREVARALNATEEQSSARRVERVNDLKLALKACESREDRAYDDFQSGVLDAEAFRRQSQRARADRQKLQAELEDMQRLGSATSRETAQSIIELCRSAKKLYLSRSSQERRDFLEMLLSNPRLRGASLEFDYRKPFLILVEMNETGEWLARLDDFRTACLLHGGTKPWNIVDRG